MEKFWGEAVPMLPNLVIAGRYYRGGYAITLADIWTTAIEIAHVGGVEYMYAQ